jgi:hypothetical protein
VSSLNAQKFVSKQSLFEGRDSGKNLQNKKNNLSRQNIPYPIIFIHGLDSNAGTWVDFGIELENRGLIYGGVIDFCLNDDGNNYTSNKLIWPTPDADISLFTDYENDINIGDFYLLNFDIDNLGRTRSSDDFVEMLSNESAIVKQGVALKIAIQMVLLKTGRDKVILMGHSMGGLAAREYIQNAVNWASDDRHHIAKLATTGTPHGGFNLLDISSSIDNRSEAYRDLRQTYIQSGENGVYLYGGLENETVINNNLTEDFYNIDVNCNSVNADNTTIIGLNEKTLPANVEYSYVIGDCTNCLLPGDNIVTEYNADLSNFYNLPLPVNEFIYTANAINPVIGLHSDLPSATIVNMQALDEPGAFGVSYEVFTNQEYKGFITLQPASGTLIDLIDFDRYKIYIDNSGSYDFTIENTNTADLIFTIIDENNNDVSDTYIIPYNSTETITQYLSVNSSAYYLEFFSTPSDESSGYPYTFSIEESSLALDDTLLNDNFKLYPNPTRNVINFDNSKTNFETLEIYNVLGQSLLKVHLDNSNQSNINISKFNSGVYTFKFMKQGMFKTIKVIKN